MNYQNQKPNLAKNRVFIINAKHCTHDDLKIAFSECGTVTDVYQIKGKDIAYITFSKVSHALAAIEMYHNKEIDTVNGKSNPIKVILASDKGEKGGLSSEFNRLFIRIDRELTTEDIKTDFSQFGQIDNIHVLHDGTGKSKGLAYVTFIKSSEAAKAIEECSNNYRAIFADSQERRVEKRQQLTTEHSPMQILNQTQSCFSSESNVLEVVVKNTVSVEMLVRLFSMVPGYQGIDTHTGMTLVSYINAKCAAFALEKLHGFEYPIGYRIMARFASSGYSDNGGIPQRYGDEAYRGGAGDEAKMSHVTYCREMLPIKRPLVNSNEDVECRLFIVSNPTSFDELLLTDIFCRFGNCIDAYFLPNKNFGYVKYASKDCALSAIDFMNGKKIMGKTLKVLEAEPPKVGSTLIEG